MKSAIAAIGVGAGIAAVVKNMEEAEKATAQLDAAFEATGRSVGLTRTRLDQLATSLQSTTKFGDDLVKEGEAILLTFDKVRGQAFERTIKVAADLSSRLGTDLKTSIRQVGLALQDPTTGLQLLRRAGVAFDDAQKNLIAGFVKTNEQAKAQNLILTELERRFKGSAVAARSTLGGALAGLKNAFGDLFEGTATSGKQAAEAVNELTKALEDPRVKKGLDRLIEGFASIAADAVRAAAALPEKLGIVDTNAYSRGGGPRRGSVRAGAIEAAPAVAALEEVRVTVRKLVDENGDLMREFREQTQTTVERAAADFTRLKETLQFLRDQGVEGGGISEGEYQKRLGAALDEALPEFDLNEIKAKYITLKKETTEIGEFMKGVWQQVGRSIQSSLSDSLYEWKISWKSFVDIARRALSDIVSAIIVSGIKEALKSQTSTSSTGGFLATVGKLFGLAGGGRYDGARIVGEDGPELVTGSGRVYNQRQLAFAGMGARINYTSAPVINIIERDDPERTKQEIFAAVASENARNQAEFVRLLGRSGVEVKG